MNTNNRKLIVENRELVANLQTAHNKTAKLTGELLIEKNTSAILEKTVSVLQTTVDSVADQLIAAQEKSEYWLAECTAEKHEIDQAGLCTLHKVKLNPKT